VAQLIRSQARSGKAASDENVSKIMLTLASVYAIIVIVTVIDNIYVIDTSKRECWKPSTHSLS
jgi:hypothetical protein